MERLLVLLLLSGAAAFLVVRFTLRFRAARLGFSLIKGGAALAIIAYVAAFLVFYKPEAWWPTLVEMAQAFGQLPGTPTALTVAAMAGALGAGKMRRRSPSKARADRVSQEAEFHAECRAETAEAESQETPADSAAQRTAPRRSVPAVPGGTAKQDAPADADIRYVPAVETMQEAGTGQEMQAPARSGAAQKRWFTGTAVLMAATLLLVGCAQPGASSATAAALDLMRQPERLRAIISANQIVFNGSGANPEAVCRCGPKLILGEIAPSMRQAVVAIEDKRFFRHRGIDPNGLIRAAARMVLSAGRRVEGASTIPQQLIKNTVLTSDREGSRKWSEWKLAWALQGAMSPDEVLAAYLNQVIFAYDRGRPIVGVENAARHFFGRRAADLSLRESATLAGLLKAPAAYNPLTHPERSKLRTATVLAAMAEQGLITPREAKAALAKRRARGPLEPIFPETRGFVQWVLADLRAQNPGIRFDRTTRIPLTLEIVTQANAEGALERAMRGNAALKRAEAGFLTVGFDGRVVAMIGGRDFTRSQLNFVTQTRRQPASTMKALVFASAFENKALKPSRFLTEKFAVSDRDTAVAAAQAVGPERITATARRLGIVSPLGRDPSNLALGAGEVSLLEMSRAYLPFAANGMGAEPYGSLGLVQDWRLVSWHEPKRTRVLSRETADAVHAMLRAVVTQGTGWSARGIKTAAGKTGTNGESGAPFNRDAWFIGMTERHLSGLWIGRPDNQPMAGIKGSTAAGVWASVEKALPGTL